MASISLGVLDYDDHGVAAQKELGDVALFVLGTRPLSFAFLWHLGPHFQHALQHHIHVPVKGLDVAEELAVVAAVDQHLAVGLDGLRQ